MSKPQRISTNIHGVVSTSAPHASPLLRRRFAELNLDEAKRVHPPTMSRLPAMRRKVLPPRLEDMASMAGIWGGCVASKISSGYSSVTGTWNIPAVDPGIDDSQGSDGWLVSHWVGLDGVGNGELLQCGVAQQIRLDGTRVIWPWYEWYIDPRPADAPEYVDAQTFDQITCKVQDKMCGMAEYFTADDGTRKGRLTLANLTNGSHNSIELDPPSANVKMPGACTEWTVEDYNGGYDSGHSLALFTPIEFTACSSEGSTDTGDPGMASVFNVSRTDGKVMTHISLVSGDHFTASYYVYNI